jgi:hypothetical protein
LDLLELQHLLRVVTVTEAQVVTVIVLVAEAAAATAMIMTILHHGQSLSITRRKFNKLQKQPLPPEPSKPGDLGKSQVDSLVKANVYLLQPSVLLVLMALLIAILSITRLVTL